MRTYQSNAAPDYDFDMFEPRARATAASAAPQRKNAPQAPKAEPQLKIVEKKAPQTQKNTGHTALRSAVILFFAVMVLGVIGLQINAGARSYELSQQIEQLEKKISEAKTENIRLTNELNSITTIENIDVYAREVLGMAKSESYQIKCIDLSENDQVLYSSGSCGLLDYFKENR